ncbi:MAG: HVO_0476 family zinc finger protein [Haloferacaceae archaeon]
MSDTERAERVPVDCPACGAETVHEVLAPGGQATVRCGDCGHTHKATIDPDPETPVDVVVSQDGESFPTAVDAPPDERVAVGEEFVVDTPEALMQVRITAIELGDDRRVEEATVADVATLWTRVVDNVGVNVTVHPTDGNRDESRSLRVYVPGDREFVVGETESLGDESFEVVGIHVRDDAAGYRFDTFDHEGDAVFAKDVKRLYGRDHTAAAWSGW